MSVLRPGSGRPVAVIAAAAIGGVAGALVAGIAGHSADRPVSAETVHAQDITLCTSYALIEAGLHHPLETGADVLPAIAPLRLALIENPDASPQIRDAIAEAVGGFDAILAKGAEPHGLSEPPAYDPATVRAALARVPQVCGLAD